MIYDTFDEAEIERSMMDRKTKHKWGIQKVQHKGPHDKYPREMYQTFIVEKNRKGNPGKRYFLYDVLNDYSIALVDGKSDFGTLAHAKKRGVTDNIDSTGRRSSKVIWSVADMPPRSHKHWYGRNTENELIYLISTHGLMRNPAKRPAHEKGFIIEDRKPKSCDYVHRQIKGFMAHGRPGQIYECGKCHKQFSVPMKNPKLAKKGNTKVIVGSGKEKTVRLYQTDIVKILSDGSIQLNSGGHKTATTKRRMNEAAKELELYFNVFAKGGEWFVATEDRLEPPQTIEFTDGMIISGPQHLRNPGKKKMARKKKRSAKQLANDKRLGRMAKARAKAKRGGARKKVARKKVAKRKTNPKRAKGTLISKRSHLWNIFKCRGNSVHFLALNSEGKIRWTLTRGDTVTWKLKSIAIKVATKLAKNRKYSKFNIGLANQHQSVPQIAAACKTGK